MTNLTPFQHDWEMMIRALEIELPRVGVADEALTRRIVRPDTIKAEKVRVSTSGTQDPAGEQAMQLIIAQEARENFRDVAVQAIWKAIKKARLAIDDVLSNEPVIPKVGAVCATRKGTPTACGKFASPHSHPDTGMVVDEYCDECWANLCMTCCMRPRSEHRAQCDACRKRAQRRGEDS